MTDTLPPYGTVRKCPKCGCHEVSNSYRAGHPRLAWHGDDMEEIYSLGGDDAGRECLLRTCQRCGWAWLEACADATPTGSDPDETSSDFYRRIGAIPCTTQGPMAHTKTWNTDPGTQAVGRDAPT